MACLVVAVQPLMEWIPIKKKKSEAAYWKQSILHFLTLIYAMQHKYGVKEAVM